MIKKSIIRKLTNTVNNSEKTALFFIILLTFLMKVVFVSVVYTNNGTGNWSDDWYYLSMGEQIAQGNWEPQMIVGPVIPLIIAFFIKIFNDPVIPMFVFNIFVTSLLVLVLFDLGKELFNKKVGWCMAIWGALFIECFKYSPHLLKEPVLFLIVPLTFLLLFKSIKHDFSLKHIALSSLSYAFLIHTDERFIIYLPFFAFAFFLVKRRSFYNSFKPSIIWIGFVLFLMLPWGIRNYKVFGQVVIISSRTTAFTSKLWGEDLAKLPFTEGYEPADKTLELAIEFGKENGIVPREYGKNEARVRAFINFWQPAYFKPAYIQYGSRPQKWSFKHNVSGLIFYGIFLPFYLVGILLLIKKKDFIGLFLATIPVIHSILHAYMVWPLERYRSPIVFIVVMIGIWAVTEIFSWLRSFYRSH